MEETSSSSSMRRSGETSGRRMMSGVMGMAISQPKVAGVGASGTATNANMYRMVRKGYVLLISLYSKRARWADAA
jgi:hypothetical protein